MKNVFRSGLMLVAVAALVIGGTGAFFSDTETSAGNVFTAGSIDLTVDHSAASYNGELCEVNCTVIPGNLIQNGSFENPTVTANSGSYQFFNSIPEWELEAGSVIELQRNFAISGDGQQHIELDGELPDPATTISQSITTVPGERYRLSFQHSPRPQSQAAGSGIRLEVEVVSPDSTVFTDTIVTGTGAISWSTYTYEFVADDVTTTIRFAYDGTVNTYGGLLDNVIVVALDCEAGYDNTPGGYCELWDKKDLDTEKFFTFDDIKPQDQGTNLISLHVESNEAYMCLNVANKVEEENTHTAPEIAAGDATGGLLEGEMGQYLEVAGWYADAAGTKLAPLFAPTLASALGAITYADSASTEPPVAPGATKFVLLEWCMGDMTTTAGSFSCDGDVPNINQTQTDAFVADLQFFAIQTRNNGDFTCTSAFEEEEGGGSEGPEVLGVSANDLAQDLPTILANPTKWFFFEDGSGIPNPFMILDQYATDGENNIVVGPEGVGAAKMLLHGNSRYNIATYQFAGTALASITNLRYRVYDASASSETPYLHFNVDFDGDDDWQSRLVMVPTAPGNDGVPLNTWTTVDAINGGNAMWCWSGMPPCGGNATAWPAQTGTPFTNPSAPYQTWSDILAAYPGVALRTSDPFFGVRVGHPGPVAEESYVDWIEVNNVQYNFTN